MLLPDETRQTTFWQIFSPKTAKTACLLFMMAIYSMNYNFCRIHQTLRVTPAMEAGISDHVAHRGFHTQSDFLLS